MMNDSLCDYLANQEIKSDQVENNVMQDVNIECTTIYLSANQNIVLHVPTKIKWQNTEYYNTASISSQIRLYSAEKWLANPWQHFRMIYRDKIKNNNIKANIKESTCEFEIKVTPFMINSQYSWLDYDIMILKRIYTFYEKKTWEGKENDNNWFRPCFIVSTEIGDTQDQMLISPAPLSTWYQLCYPNLNRKLGQKAPNIHQVIYAVAHLCSQLQFLISLDLYWLDVCQEDLIYYNDQTFQPFIRDVGKCVSSQNVVVSQLELRIWVNRFAQLAGTQFANTYEAERKQHATTFNHNKLQYKMELLSMCVLWSLCCTSLFMLVPVRNYESQIRKQGKLNFQDNQVRSMAKQAIKDMITGDLDQEDKMHQLQKERLDMFMKVHLFMKQLYGLFWERHEIRPDPADQSSLQVTPKVEYRLKPVDAVISSLNSQKAWQAFSNLWFTNNIFNQNENIDNKENNQSNENQQRMLALMKLRLLGGGESENS